MYIVWESSFVITFAHMRLYVKAWWAVVCCGFIFNVVVFLFFISARDWYVVGALCEPVCVCVFFHIEVAVIVGWNFFLNVFFFSAEFVIHRIHTCLGKVLTCVYVGDMQIRVFGTTVERTKWEERKATDAQAAAAATIIAADRRNWLIRTLRFFASYR